MSEDQAKKKLEAIEEAEQGYQGLYNVVKDVFEDVENDEEEWALKLTKFFSTVLTMAAMQAQAISAHHREELIAQVLAPMLGAPVKSEGGIVLPNGQQVT